MNFTLLYSTTLFLSFALTLILFICHLRYANSVKFVPLKFIYLLNMTSALLCMIWAVVDGKPEFIVVNYIANIIEFNCMGYCGYFWLIYCLKFVRIPVLKTKLAKVLIAMPVLIVMILIASAPFTHWAFYIDEDGFFHRGSLYIMQMMAYLYLCITSLICILYRKKCTTFSERRHLAVLAMFPLSPIIFGSIQIFMPSGLAPTLQISILISLLLVFVDDLDQKITRDSLTQLINRYEFERILQNRMNSFQNNGPKLYVLMSDMDDFKSINDNYGHQQGDIALRMVGSVMTKVSTKYNAVCARMSGDEFISLIETYSAEDVDAYNKDIEEGLKDACSHLSYKLQLSTGVADYDGNMTMLQLLNQADKNMYEQKKLHKHLEPSSS